MLIVPLIALCALACAALLVSERRGSRLGMWLSKPLAAAVFVVIGLLASPFDTSFGSWILLGLCLSWLGDVLLIPEQAPRLFLAGIGSFLAAHLAYGAAFLAIGFSATGLAITAMFALPAAFVVMRWLRPKLSGMFATAVPVYVVVIAGMLILSGSATVATGRGDLLLGAGMFAVSDLSVARERFIEASFTNGLWGLPLYFAAQIVLALSIAVSS